MTCVKGEDCHAAVAVLEPTVVSVWHLANNHIVLFASDYNEDGSVKKSSNLRSETNKVDSNMIGYFNQVINREWK
jgi:hypothetical protein